MSILFYVRVYVEERIWFPVFGLFSGIRLYYFLE